MIQKAIVLELQQLAINNDVDISDLLRKALLVATKLKLDDFKKWINQELNGYPDGVSVPKYRNVKAELMGINPFHGLVPFIIPNQEIADIVGEVSIPDAITGLEALFNKTDKPDYFEVKFSNAQREMLMKMQTQSIPYEPVRRIETKTVAEIIGAVRTTILEWSLKLESEGILGNGLSFTEEEKHKASSQSITIENFQGVLGNINDSSVTQNLNITITPGDFESLAKYLSTKGINQSDLDILQAALVNEPKPKSAISFGEKVSGWIGQMVAKAADGSWEIGINIAGTLLSAAILKYYGL